MIRKVNATAATDRRRRRKNHKSNGPDSSSSSSSSSSMFFIFCCFVWPEVKSKGLGNVLRPWNTTFWVRKARHVVGFFFVAVVGLGCARTGEGLNFFFLYSLATKQVRTYTLITNGLRRLVLVITAIM